MPFLLGDPEGSPSKIAIEVHCVRYMGDKSDDTAFSSKHVIISHLLWIAVVVHMFLLTYNTISLVPRPIPSFSMLHTACNIEKLGMGLGTRLQYYHCMIQTANMPH